MSRWKGIYILPDTDMQRDMSSSWQLSASQLCGRFFHACVGVHDDCEEHVEQHKDNQDVEWQKPKNCSNRVHLSYGAFIDFRYHTNKVKNIMGNRLSFFLLSRCIKACYNFHWIEGLSESQDNDDGTLAKLASAVFRQTSQRHVRKKFKKRGKGLEIWLE